MPTSSKPTFHLIANSHLDPVWLWDWQEGLNEAIITIRSILDLMDEFPELTYIRGETAIYETIERFDPKSFARIQRHVKAGRWDYVGGTYIQPDTNMPATETMARHFTTGQRYFASRFGKPSRVAWAADSFGHSAGLPSIFSQAGIRYYAFFRPSKSLLNLESAAFWWKGGDDSKVLAYRPTYGWYGMERGDMKARLDEYAANAGKHPFQNVAVFYGLGNHGGGPSRRHLLDIREWSQRNPGVNVVHSGLHRFFGALEKEIAEGNPVPEVKGELNYFARGCYSSAARFKFKYRKAEAGLMRAERTVSAIAAGLNLKTPDMQEPWRGLLFNSFHDILPGSSIERAMDDQTNWVGGLIHTGQKLEFEFLNALAAQINAPATATKADHPTPVTMLVWNPHAYDYEGPIELEVGLDYRPIFRYENAPAKVPVEVRNAAGAVIPFQSIATENNFLKRIPFRKRVLIDGEIPALGWTVYTVGWVEGAKVKALTGAAASAKTNREISGARFKISAEKGRKGVRIELDGKSLFSGDGFGLQTLDDPWGPWGDHYEEPAGKDISTVLETWKITEVSVLEPGPLRSSLWVRFEDETSKAEFTWHVHHQRTVIEVEARVFWNRPSARLKMVMPGVGEKAEYDVMGGTVQRGSLAEVPGGRWVRVFGPKRTFGFASDALYNFDLKDDTLRATVVRSSRYTSDVPETPETPKHYPVIDGGEYRFKFLLTTDAAALPRLAAALEAPCVTTPIAPRTGSLGRSGSFLKVRNPNLRLLALKRAEDDKGWIIRLQETGLKKTVPTLQWLNTTILLEEIARGAIASYRLHPKGKQWDSCKVRLDEVPMA